MLLYFVWYLAGAQRNNNGKKVINGARRAMVAIHTLEDGEYQVRLYGCSVVISATTVGMSAYQLWRFSASPPNNSIAGRLLQVYLTGPMIVVTINGYGYNGRFSHCQ